VGIQGKQGRRSSSKSLFQKRRTHQQNRVAHGALEWMPELSLEDSGSPMPYSIFFLRGYAIHGSYETRYLGRRASHGCVRLHPSNAAALYSLVKTYGPSNTVIRISR
jgi:L,D-transpeptidase catalytic domain